jgi:hypothetical protein
MTDSSPAWGLVEKIVAGLVLAVIGWVGGWFARKWTAGRQAEAQVARHDVVEEARKLLQPIADEIADELHADRNKARDLWTAAERRFTRLEHSVFGVDDRGGIANDLDAVKRQAAIDHEILLHLSTLVRELYRRVTREEPPAAPPMLTELPR